MNKTVASVQSSTSARAPSNSRKKLDVVLHKHPLHFDNKNKADQSGKSTLPTNQSKSKSFTENETNRSMKPIELLHY